MTALTEHATQLAAEGLEGQSTALQTSVGAAAGRQAQVLRIDGELDLLTQPVLRSLLQAAVNGHAMVVVVDTSGVTFIDRAGLAPLLEAAAQLRERGAVLLMPSASARVVRLATLTGCCDHLGLV